MVWDWSAWRRTRRQAGQCADLFGWKAMPFALEDLDSNLLQKLILAWTLDSLKKHCVMVCYLCEHIG